MKPKTMDLRGFVPILWKETRNNDIVWIQAKTKEPGTDAYKERAFGPYMVNNRVLHTLMNTYGNVSMHYPEHLIVPEAWQPRRLKTGG